MWCKCLSNDDHFKSRAYIWHILIAAIPIFKASSNHTNYAASWWSSCPHRIISTQHIGSLSPAALLVTNTGEPMLINSTKSPECEINIHWKPYGFVSAMLYALRYAIYIAWPRQSPIPLLRSSNRAKNPYFTNGYILSERHWPPTGKWEYPREYVLKGDDFFTHLSATDHHLGVIYYKFIKEE